MTGTGPMTKAQLEQRVEVQQRAIENLRAELAVERERSAKAAEDYNTAVANEVHMQDLRDELQAERDHAYKLLEFISERGGLC